MLTDALNEIASKVTQAQKLLADANALLEQLSEYDDIFDPQTLQVENAQLQTMYVKNDALFALSHPKAAACGRQTARRVEYDEDDNETVLDSIDYFVRQYRGCCEDDFYGTIYFILAENPETGECNVLSVHYDS